MTTEKGQEAKLIAQTPTVPDDLPCAYKGAKAPLFRIALQNAALNLVTLGFYRFWGKTRMRKYVWSGVVLGDDPLEYIGNGREKLVNFLKVVAVLAVCLGLVQGLLGVIGISVFTRAPADQALWILGASITLLALVPPYFYARNLALYYMLAHTRLRGITFGVEPGALGYIWRAMVYWLLTILSLGLLLPRQTFWLAKYRTDRSFYGAARFRQNGRWPDLYPAMKHIFIAVALLIAPGVLVKITGIRTLGLLAISGGLWMVFGWAYYSTKTFEILAANTSLAGAVRFRAAPRASTVIRIVVSGGLLVAVCLAALLPVFTFAAIHLAGASSFADLINAGSTLHYGPATIAGLVLIGLGCLGTLLLCGALYQVFVHQPLLAHYGSIITIRNAASIAPARPTAGTFATAHLDEM